MTPEQKSKSYAVLNRLAHDDPIIADDSVEHRYLIEREWAHPVLGFLRITSEGRLEHEEACHCSNLPQSDAVWKDEALTGITSVGKPTKIKNPAIPGNHVHSDDFNWDSLVMGWAYLLNRAEKALKMTRNEIIDGLASGCVRVCTGFKNQPAKEHLGRFSKSANGKYWRSVCNACEYAKYGK